MALQFQNCEICKINQGRVAMNDETESKSLHFSCFNHVTDLWDKLGKPKLVEEILNI